jgi:hypothetical protein
MTDRQPLRDRILPLHDVHVRHRSWWW